MSDIHTTQSLAKHFTRTIDALIGRESIQGLIMAAALICPLLAYIFCMIVIIQSDSSIAMKGLGVTVFVLLICTIWQRIYRQGFKIEELKGKLK